MKLTFKEDYLSISKFKDVELPDFTVLTGINGSGKTHLLQAIEQGKVLVEDIKIHDIIHFSYENFRLEKMDVVNPYELVNKKRRSWFLFEREIKNNLISWKTQHLGEDYKTIINLASTKEKSIWSLQKRDFIDQNIYEKLSKYKFKISELFENNKLKAQSDAGGIFVLIKQLPYAADELTEKEFCDLYNPASSDFLQKDLSLVFWDYYVKFIQNKVNKLNNIETGSNYPVLEDDDFIKKYGEKPWDLINRIMETFGNFDYRINPVSSK